MTALTAQETDALRRLAGALAEIAALPVQNQKRALWRRLNRLEKVRPLVWISEVCWEQITGPEMEMQVQSDPFLRGIEWSMRASLRMQPSQRMLRVTRLALTFEPGRYRGLE